MFFQSFHDTSLLKVNFFLRAKRRSSTGLPTDIILVSCLLVRLKSIDGLLQHAQHHCIKHERPHNILFLLGHESGSMRHHYIIKGVDIGSPDLSPVILAQVFNALKNHDPSILKRVRFWLYLAWNKVSHILKHTDCDQVIVDVVATVACIEMDRVQDCLEVGQRQLRYVIAHDKFQATESAWGYLVLLCLNRFWNWKDDYAPAIVFNLLPALLYYLLEAF